MRIHVYILTIQKLNNFVFIINNRNEFNHYCSKNFAIHFCYSQTQGLVFQSLDYDGGLFTTLSVFSSHLQPIVQNAFREIVWKHKSDPIIHPSNH